MSRKPALLRTLAVLLLGGAALFAGVPAKAAETVTATELTPIPNPSLAYNRMAMQMGLFKKHGLDFKLGADLAGGGPERVQAVATNNTDIATSDIIAVMGGDYSGANIRILMAMTPYGDEEIWARSQIKSMQDAMHQLWAVASLAGAQRFNAQMAIEGMHLDPNGFRWLAIPGGDGPALQALESNRVELASLSHLGAALAEKQGFTKDVHILVPHTAKYTPPLPRLVAIAREDWIKAHEDAAERYVETMLDMMRQWQTSADAWTKPGEAIYKDSGLSAKQMEAAWKEFRDGGYFSVNGGVNYAATQKIMDMFFAMRGDKPNQYVSKPEDIYDTGPLKAALAKMGVVKGTPGLPDAPDWDKSALAKDKSAG